MLYTIFLKIKYRGLEYKHLRELLNIKLGKSDTVIDCGANVGEVTKLLARNGSKVFAFEPNPSAFEVLRNETSGMSNVSCINSGVYTNNGKMKLYLHEWAAKDQVVWSNGSSLLPYKKNINKKEYVDVNVVDLSEFILQLESRVKLMKMDIEGAECDVINHLITTGAIRKIDHLFVERHDNKIDELKPVMIDLERRMATEGIKNVYFDWI